MIPSSQLSRGLGIASLAMLLWSVGIMYLSFGMVRAGSVPLGMELSSLGPFLNNQLCAGYALNVIFLAVEMYRLLRERTVLHPGCVISPAVIYLDFFYIDILGRMDTLDSVWKALDRGTVLILLEAVPPAGDHTFWIPTGGIRRRSGCRSLPLLTTHRRSMPR